MDMTLYHADASGAELRVIWDVVSADIEINIASGAAYINNTFEVVISESAWASEPVRIGHMLYIPQTEWGGVVSLVKHSTSDKTVTLIGPTWRGLLYQRTIDPATGSAYKTITSVDANEAIRQAVGSKFGTMFSVANGSSGISVSGSWRYDTIAAGLNRVLSDAGARLVVLYDNVSCKVKLSAERVVDQSETIEISQDYGVEFTSNLGAQQACNHCLALGSGELVERMVRSVYYSGGTFYTSKPAGWDDSKTRTVVLDYPNAEDENDLIKSAVNRLREVIPAASLSVDQLMVGLDVGLGDIVGVRDWVTGMVATAVISNKILTVADGVAQITAKVG